MVQNKKRIISLILMLTLLVSSLVVGAITASAADNTYQKVTSMDTITTGTYVIVVNGKVVTRYDSGWVLTESFTDTGDTIVSDSIATWTLTVSGSSVTIKDANGTFIKPKSGNNNGIQTGSYNWALSINNGKFNFKGTGSDTTILALNKQEGKIRAYKTSTVSGNANSYPSGFELYKLVESGSSGHECDFTGAWKTNDTQHWKECTVSGCTQTSNPVNHDFNVFVSSTDATCVKDGSITNKCECGKTQTTTIPAKHNYVDGTCSGCGAEDPNSQPPSGELTEKVVTITTSQLGINNGVDFGTKTIEEIIFVAGKGSNSSGNTPKYYNTGTALRFYTGNTLTITAPEGYMLSKVELVCNSGYSWVGDNSGVVSGINNSTVSLKHTGTEQARVGKIIVTLVPECKHNWSEWTQITAPDCVNAGKETRSCTVCSAVENNSIEALGHTEVVDAAVTATCAATGLTEGKHCSVCDTVIVAQEETPKTTTHSYDNHTCTVCGGTQPRAFYYVNGKVHGKEDGYYNNLNKINLRTEEDIKDDIPSHLKYAYTFVGWAMATMGEDSDIAPTVYAGGKTVEITENTNFYAVFSYSIGGAIQENNDYVLTGITDIKANDEVIIVMNVGKKYYALPTVSKPDVKEVTISNGKIAEGVADNLLWNIVATEGGYVIRVNGSTSEWLFCADDNDGVRVGYDTDNNVFTLSGNYLKNTGRGRYLGVYDNKDWRCYTNTSGNIINQSVAFYVKSSGSDLKFTTTLVSCTHEYDDCVDTICNNANCNFERVAPGHTYNNACDADCNNCGATRTPAAHVYDNNCDTTCNVCNAEREITHTPGAAADCENAQTCTVCGDVLNAALGHTPGVAADCENAQTCTVCGDVLNAALGHSESCAHVAVIGDKAYTDLQVAVNEAVDGNTIKLIKNVALKTYLNIWQEGQAARTITLDLNGCTISAADDYTYQWYPLVFVGVKQNVTITGNGKITAKDKVTIGVYGTLDIVNGTFENFGNTDKDSVLCVWFWDPNDPDNNGYDAYVGGNCAIEGGKFVGEILCDESTKEGVTTSLKVNGGDFSEATLVINSLEQAVKCGLATKNDSTIVLNRDITIDGDVVVTNGMTIDLNGHTLTTKAAIVFNGQIKGAGFLVVDKGNFSISDNATLAEVPVKYAETETTETYIFRVATTLTAEAPAGKDYLFRPTLSGYGITNNDIFCGSVNNNLVLKLRVTRTSVETGLADDPVLVTIPDSVVREVYAKTSTGFAVILSGENAAYTYSVEFVIVSCGVEVYSAPIAYVPKANEEE